MAINLVVTRGVFLFALAACSLFPPCTMAQGVSAKAERLLSPEDEQKLARAEQLYKQATSFGRASDELNPASKERNDEPLFAEVLRLRREVLGAKHPDTLNSLIDYARVLNERGRASEAESHFAKVLRLRREVLGVKHPDTLNSLVDYASVLYARGRDREAEPLFAEALRLMREVLGSRHPDTLNSLNNYATVLQALGRSGEAEPLFAETLRLRREVLGVKDTDTQHSLNNYAFVLMQLGRASEAEPLLAEILRLQQEDLGAKHPATVDGLNDYALVLLDLGRAVEAEPLLAEALRLNQEGWGAKHPKTIGSLSNYADVLNVLGRASEAEPLFAKVLQSDQERLGPKHPKTLNSLNNYAGVLNGLGRAEEAEQLFVEALRLKREVLGAKHPDTLLSLNDYAGVLQALDRAVEAEPLFAETLRSRREVLGAKHPETLDSLNKLSNIRIRLPFRSHLALEPARTLAREIRTARKVAGFTPSEEARLAREEKSQSDQFRLFSNAAWSRGPGLVAEAQTAGAKPLTASEQAGLREEVFTALQDTLASAASKAISATVARKAAGPLEPLAIEREELSLQWIAIDKALIKIIGESSGANNDIQNNRRNNLRAELAKLETRMKKIDQRLQKEAPEYFALIRPEALSLAKARELLTSDEAALMIIPTAYGTHIMLVSDAGLRWVRSDWAADKVDAAVKRLLWDVGADVDTSAADTANWSEQGNGAYPYAFESAYALYQQLIAPIADSLKGKRHVFISASGSLSSLPFGMLVSNIPTGDNGNPDVLRSAKWFADDHALIQIPTLQSLEFLRKYRASDGKIASLPFLGIGDPVLTGKSEVRGSRRSNQGNTRSVNAKNNGAFKHIFNGTATRGGTGIANVSELRKMARLPGTATELTAMWEEFGKPANSLYLDDQATEGFVRTKSLDANIIAFATHGLLAGEIAGAAEPGLVLTPPSQASESNDGYLSASEISALKLNADWVILSACNTAAGDGSEGAPGLSGLARSFFYAGARNLLASHWPVRDDVAAKLTVRTISIAKDNPELSRAEAFQQAMRDIRNDENADTDNDTWAHPSAWAPFSLIGDGAN